MKLLQLTLYTLLIFLLISCSKNSSTNPEISNGYDDPNNSSLTLDVSPDGFNAILHWDSLNIEGFSHYNIERSWSSTLSGGGSTAHSSSSHIRVEDREQFSVTDFADDIPFGIDMNYRVNLCYEVEINGVKENRNLKSNEVIFKSSDDSKLIEYDGYFNAQFFGDQLIVNSSFNSINIYSGYPLEMGRIETGNFNQNFDILDSTLYVISNRELSLYSLSDLQLLTKYETEPIYKFLVPREDSYIYADLNNQTSELNYIRIGEDIPFETYQLSSSIKEIIQFKGDRRFATLSFNGELNLFDIKENGFVISSSTMVQDQYMEGKIATSEEEIFIANGYSIARLDTYLNITEEIQLEYYVDDIYVDGDKIYIASNEEECRSKLITYSLEPFEMVDQLNFPTRIYDLSIDGDLASILHINSIGNYYIKKEILY